MCRQMLVLSSVETYNLKNFVHAARFANNHLDNFFDEKLFVKL